MVVQSFALHDLHQRATECNEIKMLEELEMLALLTIELNLQEVSMTHNGLYSRRRPFLAGKDASMIHRRGRERIRTDKSL